MARGVAIVVVAAVGLFWWSRPPAVFGSDLAWSGEHFVVIGDDNFWTTSDGIEWSHQSGTPLLAAQFGKCPDGHRCNVNPATQQPPPSVPYHHARATIAPVAALESVVLLGEWWNYEVFAQRGSPDDSDLPQDLIALLAQEGEPCFALAAAGDPKNSVVATSSAGMTYDGAWSYTLTARCHDEISQQWSHVEIDLGKHLTTDQLAQAAVHCIDRLWVEQADGTIVKVVDAPREVPGKHPGPFACVSHPVATNRHFYAIDGTLNGDRLLRSVDGLVWKQVALPASVEAAHLERVVAAPGGSVAIELKTSGGDQDGRPGVIISHDDAATWSKPIEAPYGRRALSVGPAGLVVSDGPETYLATESTNDVVSVDPGLATSVAGADSVLVLTWNDDGDEPTYKVYPASP